MAAILSGHQCVNSCVTAMALFVVDRATWMRQTKITSVHIGIQIVSLDMIQEYGLPSYYNNSPADVYDVMGGMLEYSYEKCVRWETALEHQYNNYEFMKLFAYSWVYLHNFNRVLPADPWQLANFYTSILEVWFSRLYSEKYSWHHRWRKLI